MSDEWFEEEEYIDDNNDPEWVEKITKEDYAIIENESTADFDEVFESVKTKITNLTNHDHMMEEKVLDALRKGKLK